MDPTLILSAFLIATVLALVLLVRYHNERTAKLEEDVAWAAEERRRLMSDRATRGGQWAPLLSGYPFDPRNFRFLGWPVEGVQFEADRIVFVSLGTTDPADAARVRDLVRAGRVEFTEAGAPAAPGPLPPAASDAPPAER